MKTRLARWGNSSAVRLPKAAVEALGIGVGDEVELTVSGREVRIMPTRLRGSALLKQMIEEAERLGPENRPEVVDWGPDVGAEVLENEDWSDVAPRDGDE